MPHYPAALQQILAGGNVQVIRTFKTQKKGMLGYVLHRPGDSHNSDAIVYAEDGYMIAGHLFGPNAKDLSKIHAEKYIPHQDVSSLIGKIEKSAKPIKQGQDGAPVLYAFIDPNCIFCHRFYESAEPLVKAGRLQIRWVMVGFLKASSTGRSAAILSADDRVAAIEKNEDGFIESPEHGGITPKSDVSDKTKALLAANAKLMNDAGGDGTPTLLYKQGGKWRVKVGAPSSAWLSSYAAPKHKSGTDE